MKQVSYWVPKILWYTVENVVAMATGRPGARDLSHIFYEFDVFANFIFPGQFSLFSETFIILSCSVPDFQICWRRGDIVVIRIAFDSDKTVTWGRPSTVASETLDNRRALHAGQHVSWAEEKSFWPLINSQLVWDFHGASLRCWYCAVVLAACQDGLCCQPLGGRCCLHLQGRSEWGG